MRSTHGLLQVILRFQKWSYVVVLGFQIERCCRYFGLFCLGDFLSYFLKNWAIFFSDLLVTLAKSKNVIPLVLMYILPSNRMSIGTGRISFFLFLELVLSRHYVEAVQGSCLVCSSLIIYQMSHWSVRHCQTLPSLSNICEQGRYCGWLAHSKHKVLRTIRTGSLNPSSL